MMSSALITVVVSFAVVAHPGEFYMPTIRDPAEALGQSNCVEQFERLRWWNDDRPGFIYRAQNGHGLLRVFYDSDIDLRIYQVIFIVEIVNQGLSLAQRFSLQVNGADQRQCDS